MTSPKRCLAMAACLMWLVGCGEMRPPADDGLENVDIAGETFRLEVAADDETRQRGLMERESIPADGGMLFIFPDAQIRNFWMGYCLVDIDIIYLDPAGRITAVHRMIAQPPRREDETAFEYETRLRRTDYHSRYAAQFAIELRSGSLDRLGVRVDDKIDLDLERLKGMAR